MTRLLSAFIHQLGTTADDAKQNSIDFARLEDRILFSASPLAEALLSGDAADVDQDVDAASPEHFSLIDAQAAGVVYAVSGETRFSGGAADHIELQHSADLELNAGTIALSFVADEVDGKNALFSKDARERQDGGLTALIENGRLKVRLENSSEPRWLVSDHGAIQAGVEYHMTVSFGDDGFSLYLNGELQAEKTYWKENLANNTENLLIGATGWWRNQDEPNLAHHRFQGVISDFTIYDAQITSDEAPSADESSDTTDGEEQQAPSSEPPELVESDLPPGAVYALSGETRFDGGAADHIELQHSADLELNAGTIALSFVADEVDGKNALFSKDARERQDGGLTALIENGRLKVRLENSSEPRWLVSDHGAIQAGVEYHMTVSFGDDGFSLYLNGELQAEKTYWKENLANNTENLLIGATGWWRNQDEPNLAHHRFQGTISNFIIFDSQFTRNQIDEPDGAAVDGRDEVLLPAQDEQEPVEDQDQPQLPGDVVDDDAPVFNIQDFGAVADGVTDARDAIVAALNAAEATGGPAEVYIPEGQYEVSSAIDHLFQSDLRIYGSGTLTTDDTIVLRSNTGSLLTLEDFTITPSSTSVKTALEIRSTGWPDQGALVADADSGDGSIALSNTSGIEVGDVMWIVSDELWPFDPLISDRDPPKGELQRVVEVTGDTITTSDPLWNSYDVADGAGDDDENVIARALKPIQLAIDGISIDFGPDVWTTDNNTGLRISGVADSEIANVYTRGAAHSGIKMSRAYNVTVRDCEFVDDGDANRFLGYGAQISASTDVHFIDCNSTNTRHAIDFIAGEAPVHRSSVTGGVFVGKPNYGSPLSTHPGANYITFSDLTVVGGRSGIVVRSPNTTIENVTFVQPLEQAVLLHGGTGAQIINNSMTLDDFSGFTPRDGFGDTFLKVQEPDGSLTFDHDPTATDQLIVSGNVATATDNFIESRNSTNGTWLRVVVEDNVVNLQGPSNGNIEFIDFQDNDMTVRDSLIRNNTAIAETGTFQAIRTADPTFTWESTVIEGNSDNFNSPAPL